MFEGTNSGNGNGEKESALGLVATNLPRPLSTEVASRGFGRPITRDEKRITEEFHKQVLVIQAVAEKTTFGQAALGDVHEHGQGVFAKGVRTIFAIKKKTESAECESYLEEFSRVTVQSLGQSLIRTYGTSAAAIETEIARPLYPPPEEKSLFRRLFG